MDVRGRTEVLKRERATRGLTVRAAASQAAISPETLRRIEQGKNARLPAAMAIAALYERELEDLFELGEPTVEEQVISALLEAAAFPAKHANDDLAQRARQLVREFRPSQNIDRREL